MIYLFALDDSFTSQRFTTRIEQLSNYWGVAAHLAYDMFSWYKYLNFILVFSHPSVFGVEISF